MLLFSFSPDDLYFDVDWSFELGRKANRHLIPILFILKIHTITFEASKPKSLEILPLISLGSMQSYCSIIAPTRSRPICAIVSWNDIKLSYTKWLCNQKVEFHRRKRWNAFIHLLCSFCTHLTRYCPKA